MVRIHLCGWAEFHGCVVCCSSSNHSNLKSKSNTKSYTNGANLLKLPQNSNSNVDTRRELQVGWTSKQSGSFLVHTCTQGVIWTVWLYLTYLCVYREAANSWLWKQCKQCNIVNIFLFFPLNTCHILEAINSGLHVLQWPSFTYIYVVILLTWNKELSRLYELPDLSYSQQAMIWRFHFWTGVCPHGMKAGKWGMTFLKSGFSHLSDLHSKLQTVFLNHCKPYRHFKWCTIVVGLITLRCHSKHSLVFCGKELFIKHLYTYTFKHAHTLSYTHLYLLTHSFAHTHVEITYVYI